MWMCGAMVLVALIVVLATGSAFAVLPAIGCALMMVAMMWMMRRGMSHAGHRHSDNLTPPER
jgi:hypothetical protein